MQSLIFESANGVINIGQTKPYILQRVDGVTGLNSDIYSHTAPNQDGNTFDFSLLKARNITLNVAVFAADLATLNTYRRSIINIMNPKLSGTLTYTNGTYTKKIDVQVERSPYFSEEDKLDIYQSFFVSLIASEPFWNDTDDSFEVMAISVPKFKFPLRIIEHFVFAEPGINVVDCNNVGDVETPVTIYFSGPAVNPKVTNETTGEYIKVNKTLLDGERLIISTKFGNKSVIFDNGSTQTNAFNLIDLNSTFFQLRTGLNTLNYTADTGIETASVRVVWKNKYIGV